MEIHAHTLVSMVLTGHPYAEEVFTWHGVDPHLEHHAKMSLYALCWVRGIELQQLLDDLEKAIAAEEDPTDELSPDEWTDEQRKPLNARDDETWDWGDAYSADPETERVAK